MKKEEYELAFGKTWDNEDAEVKNAYVDEAGENTIGFPGNNMPVITIEKPDVIQDYRFGFIPNWLNPDKLKEVKNTFNARIETITELATWRDAWRKGQRCIVCTNGFYEFNKAEKRRIFIHLKNIMHFYYAGIYNNYVNKQTGEIIKTMAIITTSANSLVSQVHNRMPVIIKPGDENLWMDNSADLNHLLIQFSEPINANFMVMENAEQKPNKSGQTELFG